MLKSFPKLAIAVALLGFSGIGSATEGGGGASGGTYGRPTFFWTCRAELRNDDSGMFWLGIGKNQTEAWAKAYDKCQLFGRGRSCFVTCDPTL